MQQNKSEHDHNKTLLVWNRNHFTERGSKQERKIREAKAAFQSKMEADGEWEPQTSKGSILEDHRIIQVGRDIRTFWVQLVAQNKVRCELRQGYSVFCPSFRCAEKSPPPKSRRSKPFLPSYSTASISSRVHPSQMQDSAFILAEFHEVLIGSFLPVVWVSIWDCWPWNICNQSFVVYFRNFTCRLDLISPSGVYELPGGLFQTFKLYM